MILLLGVPIPVPVNSWVVTFPILVSDVSIESSSSGISIARDLRLRTPFAPSVEKYFGFLMEIGWPDFIFAKINIIH
jgi:hypothetical protein